MRGSAVSYSVAQVGSLVWAYWVYGGQGLLAALVLWCLVIGYALSRSEEP